MRRDDETVEDAKIATPIMEAKPLDILGGTNMNTKACMIVSLPDMESRKKFIKLIGRGWRISDYDCLCVITAPMDDDERKSIKRRMTEIGLLAN